ncbi:MAG: hypothetical protein FJX72_21465, partial [Armatimonadetes bacterium]|nr:hypothetical protein [Armatimonadota bacterium]
MVPQRPPAWKPQTERGIVVACEGVVSASQPLAVSAGIEVLKDGGSCIDAAIAISATLTVIEPYNSHIGGDAFAIVWDGRERRPTAYNGSGRSPAALDADAYAGGIPPRGLRAATVPGLVDCWFALHGRFGRLPFDRLLAPAIGYAERGFPAGFGYS